MYIKQCDMTKYEEMMRLNMSHKLYGNVTATYMCVYDTDHILTNHIELMLFNTLSNISHLYKILYH